MAKPGKGNESVEIKKIEMLEWNKLLSYMFTLGNLKLEEFE